MLALPPVPPTVGIHTQVRLPRDYSVRVGSNDDLKTSLWFAPLLLVACGAVLTLITTSIDDGSLLS